MIFSGEDTACAEEFFDVSSLLLVELAIDVEECIAAAAAAIPAAECINEFWGDTKTIWKDKKIYLGLVLGLLFDYGSSVNELIFSNITYFAGMAKTSANEPVAVGSDVMLLQR